MYKRDSDTRYAGSFGLLVLGATTGLIAYFGWLDYRKPEGLAEKSLLVASADYVEADNENPLVVVEYARAVAGVCKEHDVLNEKIEGLESKIGILAAHSQESEKDFNYLAKGVVADEMRSLSCELGRGDSVFFSVFATSAALLCLGLACVEVYDRLKR